MIDERVFANAQADIVRLDGKLRELRLEEERCQLARARLEAERARVQALVDLGELVRRFDVPLPDPDRPKPVVITRADGTRFVDVAASRAALAAYEVDREAEPAAISEAAEAVLEQRVRGQVKPDGLPSVARMITTVLAEAARRGRDSLAPREIRAAIRQRWWPDAPHAVISSRVWRMGQMDQLRKIGPSGPGRQYGLPTSAKGRQPLYEDVS